MYTVVLPTSRSQWPRGLRRMSAVAHLLRLWVRNPPGHGCLFGCCVLSNRGLCDELITRPGESYCLGCVIVCDLKTLWMRRPWSALGRSAPPPQKKDTPYKRNDEILEESKVEPVDKKLRRYKSNWLRHVTRINSSTMTKVLLNYRPNGRRRLERPLKRLFDEAETGLSRPDWWWVMMTMMMMTPQLELANIN